LPISILEISVIFNYILLIYRAIIENYQSQKIRNNNEKRTKSVNNNSVF